MTTITGNDTAQTLYGTAAADLIKGMGGNDVIYGKAGNDKIYGGTGADTLYGDAGQDWLYGEAGADILKGGTGVSYLNGGSDNDKLYYTPFAAGDTLTYGSSALSSSKLDGGTGYDIAYIGNPVSAGGYPTATTVFVQDNGVVQMSFDKTGPNADADQFQDVGTAVNVEELVLSGPGGANIYTDMYGAGPLKITGTEGSDTFNGGYGNEVFIGGAGNDVFYASGGTDRWTGGAGVDDYIIDYPQGDIVITDFEGAGKAGGDRLAFTHESLHSPTSQIHYANGHTVIDMGQGNTIDVVGIINSNDYIFVS